MAIPAVLLPSLLLLLLCCHGNWRIDGLPTAEPKPDQRQGRSADGDRQHPPRTGSPSTARSSCTPLGRYLSCYNVVVIEPTLTLQSAGSGRPAEVAVDLTVLGRRFKFRLFQVGMSVLCGILKICRPYSITER